MMMMMMMTMKKKKKKNKKWISKSHWSSCRADWKVTSGISEGFAASFFFIVQIFRNCLAVVILKNYIFEYVPMSSIS